LLKSSADLLNTKTEKTKFLYNFNRDKYSVAKKIELSYNNFRGEAEKMNIPKFAENVREKLSEKGYESFFVGGAVRDICLGREAHDYDITTNATPDEIKSCFKDEKVITIGEKHGTIGVLTEGEVIEVTTYRIDGEYNDNRHPKNVSFTKNIKEDLARRDFTMNAIAFDGEFTDPFGGREDIQNKIIRSVGDADIRFEEDALRILRAMRFSSVLGFKIENETKKSIHKKRMLIKNISEERIYSEFKKLIMGENAESVLLEFSDVVAVFIPEIEKCIGFDQKSKYHIYDVYTHSVKAMTFCPYNETIRLAAFFHDVGKPCCFTEDENGGHFYSHSKYSRELTSVALERLKADNQTRELVTELVSQHDRIINADKRSVRRILSKYSFEFFDMLMALKRGDALAHSPGEYSDDSYVDKIIAVKNEIQKDNECFSLKKLNVNGNDMIELGFCGKEIGKILNLLLESVMDERVKNEHDALIEEAKVLKNEKTSTIFNK
jgi:tRNA nucleotidyltransferase (CCA-adding enzyme)